MPDRKAIVPQGYEVQYEDWKLAPAIRVGNTLYCSGQIGIGQDGALPEGAEAQLVNAFEHVKSVLEAAGAGFRDVVEITSFHVGLLDQLETFSRVRDRYLHEPYPAQTAIGVAELGMAGALVEIKATAVLRS